MTTDKARLAMAISDLREMLYELDYGTGVRPTRKGLNLLLARVLESNVISNEIAEQAKYLAQETNWCNVTAGAK